MFASNRRFRVTVPRAGVFVRSEVGRCPAADLSGHARPRGKEVGEGRQFPGWPAPRVTPGFGRGVHDEW